MRLAPKQVRLIIFSNPAMVDLTWLSDPCEQCSLREPQQCRPCEKAVSHETNTVAL